jgi:hypothetical protein
MSNIGLGYDKTLCGVETLGYCCVSHSESQIVSLCPGSSRAGDVIDTRTAKEEIDKSHQI